MLGNVNLTILQQNLLSLSSTNKYELVVVENEDLYRYEWLFTIDLLMPLLSVDYSQMKYQLAEAWMFDNSTSMLMQNVVELHNSLLSSFIFISEKKFFAMKLMRHIFLRFIFTCVAEGESRSRIAVTPSVCPSVCPSVPKSCHRNSSETTDPIIMKLGM